MPVLSTTVWRIIIAVLFVLLVAGALTVRSCSNSRQEAAQAQQDARTASATTEAAKSAVEAVVARSEAEADLRQVVTEAAKEISDAQGSEQTIHPAARAAALRSACRLPAYAREPQCLRNDGDDAAR